ncbi:MAG: ATP-binding protein [Chitinispirillaceae bacterium]
MDSIHLCLQSQHPEIEQFLKSHYEVDVNPPHEMYALCVVDTPCLNRVAHEIEKLKTENEQVFMPVILVSDPDEQLDSIENIEIVDEIMREPCIGTEIALQSGSLLRAHQLSAKAAQLVRKDIELELAARRLDNLSENVPGMIYQFAVLHEGEMRFEYISEGCRQLFEVDPVSAIKNPNLIVGSVHPEERQYFQNNLSEAIRERKKWEWEGRFLVNDKIKWIKGQSSPHYADYGLIWDGVMMDVTELKVLINSLQRKNSELTHLNRELDRANAKLKDIDAAKLQFVNTAAHEIRTSVTSILGFIQALRSPDIQLSEESRQAYLSIVESESKRLSNLVDTLLNISRLDEGRQTLQKTVFQMSKLVEEVKDTVLQQQSRVVRIAVHENAKGRVFADKSKIEMVIGNILNNAVRYTDTNGLIEITLSRTGEEVVVAIKDNGPGIPPEKIQNIFEKFYRVREDQTSMGRGSGLGLSIAREIVLAHHGKIWAESEVGKGSTFYFTLPLLHDDQR